MVIGQKVKVWKNHQTKEMDRLRTQFAIGYLKMESIQMFVVKYQMNVTKDEAQKNEWEMVHNDEEVDYNHFMEMFRVVEKC
jgi:hypothetical protein